MRINHLETQGKQLIFSGCAPEIGNIPRQPKQLKGVRGQGAEGQGRGGGEGRAAP